MKVTTYAFYNNKGGVGKTTLCQNVACRFAQENPKKQVLVIDLCPQANISQFLLGGGHAGYETNQKIQSSSSRKNIVGYMDWLLKGNANSIPQTNYSVNASNHNPHISENLYLIAGDSFLEALSLALNYAVINPANTNSWKEYMTAIRRLCSQEFDPKKYESLTVFIDCNPSFSIYTQMGLISSDRIIVPMMADYSSLEGIKGILMLLYGKYPSAAQKKYAENIVTFNKKASESGIKLPQMYEFVFNNFTSNLGVAKAYNALRSELMNYCFEEWSNSPQNFSATTNKISSEREWQDTFVSNVKDFHTAGKVSSSLGIPLHRLNATFYQMPDGERVQISSQTLSEAIEHIESLVNKIQ